MNINQKVLQAAVAELSQAARKRILAPYTDARFGMRYNLTPANAFWYAEHRKDECSVALLLGLEAPEVGPKKNKVKRGKR